MFREKAITISGPVEVISVTGAPDAAKRSACTKCHTKVVNIPKGGPPIRGWYVDKEEHMLTETYLVSFGSLQSLFPPPSFHFPPNFTILSTFLSSSPYQSKDRGVGWFKPQFHIFCADKMNTTGIHPSQINDGLPKYLGLPKSMGGDGGLFEFFGGHEIMSKSNRTTQLTDKVITTNKM